MNDPGTAGPINQADRSVEKELEDAKNSEEDDEALPFLDPRDETRSQTFVHCANLEVVAGG
jgi:hypothetical protein